MSTPEPAADADPAAVQRIPIEDLLSNAHNPRRAVAASPGLVESIRASGIVQPLIVTPVGRWVRADGAAGPDAPAFRVIAGHRRLAAAIKAGLAEVPCIVRADLDDAPDQIVAMLAENSDREGLTTSEEADAYQALLDLGLTPAKVAKKTGRKRKDVDASLALAAAPETARTAVDAGRATLDDIAALAEFEDDHEKHERLAAALGTGSFKVRVEMARIERDRAADYTAAIASLQERGVRAVSWRDLADEAVEEAAAASDAELDDEAREDLEDDAEQLIDDAWVELDAEPDDPSSDDVRAIVDDLDPSEVAWFRRRIGDDTDGETTKADAARAEQTAAAAARRAAAEEQQRVCDELAAAARVRWTHLAGEAAACTTGHASEVMDALIRDTISQQLRNARAHPFVRAVLGLSPADWNLDGIDAEIEEAARAVARMPLPQKAATLYFLQRANIEVHRMCTPGYWRSPEGQWQGAQIVAWQEELSLEWRYQLADIEHRLVVEGETARAEAAAAAGDGVEGEDAGDGAA